RRPVRRRAGTYDPRVFFRKSEEKRQQEDASRAEIERLRTLSPESLAIEVLPAFGSADFKGGLRGARVQEIIEAMGLKNSLSVNTGMLLIPVREALQRLEHANLVMQMASGVDNATHWRITSEGEQAL